MPLDTGKRRLYDVRCRLKEDMMSRVEEILIEGGSTGNFAERLYELEQVIDRTIRRARRRKGRRLPGEAVAPLSPGPPLYTRLFLRLFVALAHAGQTRD